MDNYLELALEDVYEILCEGGYQWPKHFTVTEKYEMIDQMIEYFASKDEFEKCTRLQSIKQSVI
jgi:hypothetical protein